jgi:hypothetical protein
MRRLYVVVRDDLAPGLQMAQACHAVREFTLRRPDVDVGENLVVLGATPAELARLLRATDGLPSVAFYEPDLGDELTAAAFSGDARPLLSCLPLALRGADASNYGDGAGASG